MSAPRTPYPVAVLGAAERTVYFLAAVAVIALAGALYILGRRGDAA